MYFTECERLAERHPDLAVAIYAIDAQLGNLGTAEVVRADDWASFLGLDPNQVSAVLEKLSREGLLCGQEMVECAHCRMAVLRCKYSDLLEEDGEYRCTSCDRPLTDSTVRGITTYRRGDKWEESEETRQESDSVGAAETRSAGSPRDFVPDREAWYTHDRLAEIFSVKKDALRKRLDRYRESNLNGWKENEDRRPREPKYLYQLKHVGYIIEDLRASSERPAK